MLTSLNNLPPMYQGVLYISAGLMVLMYALGFIEKGITLIIILFACYLIGIGAVRSGLYGKIVTLLHKK